MYRCVQFDLIQFSMICAARKKRTTQFGESPSDVHNDISVLDLSREQKGCLQASLEYWVPSRMSLNDTSTKRLSAYVI